MDEKWAKMDPQQSPVDWVYLGYNTPSCASGAPDFVKREPPLNRHLSLFLDGQDRFFDVSQSAPPTPKSVDETLATHCFAEAAVLIHPRVIPTLLETQGGGLSNQRFPKFKTYGSVSARDPVAAPCPEFRPP